MILWNYDNFTNNNITTEQRGYKNSRSKLNKSPAWHANSFIISSSYVNTIFRETKPSEISKIYYILKLGYTQKRKNKKRSNKSWRTSTVTKICQESIRKRQSDPTQWRARVLHPSVAAFPIAKAAFHSFIRHHCRKSSLIYYVTEHGQPLRR